MQPKILVPVADTKTTRRTLDALIQQKNRFPTEVTLLHVVNLDGAFAEYVRIPAAAVRQGNVMAIGENV